jgi:hypothetical protein
MNRNIPFNKFLPKSSLVKKLEAILDRDEAHERYTINEAKWNFEWEAIKYVTTEREGMNE